MSDIVILHSGEPALLDPTQSGFAHGFGIFETIKLSAGRLCFWEAHWARLSRSANELGLDLDCSAEAVLRAIGELVRTETISAGVVKLSLLADKSTCPSLPANENGSCRENAGDTLAVAPDVAKRPTRLFVYSRPSTPSADSAQVRLSPESPLNERSLLAGHKTHNYMENMLLLESARSAGYSDVIRVNTAGFLAETTIGNLFFIEGGRLSTPALGTGILPGVIRREVLQAAGALSISLEEGVYLPEQLQHADAVFTTNSSVGILPVQTVECDAWQITLESEAHPVLHALTEALAASEEQNSIQL